MCGQAGNKRGLRVDRIPLFVSFSRFCPVPASALLWFRLQFSFRPSGSGFRSAFSLPAPASALLSASRSRLPGPGHGPAPLLSLFAVPLGCPSWLSLLTAPPRLLGEDLLFDLLDHAAECLVGLDEIRYGLARVEHRGVVAASDGGPDGRQRRLGVLLGQIHGDLAGLGDFARALRGVEAGEIQIEVFAHDLDDVVMVISFW